MQQKVCSKCNESKSLVDYHKDYKRDKYNSQCKLCANTAAKLSHRKRRVEAINSLGGECVVCGEAYLAFLQIDHVNDDGYLAAKLGPSGYVSKSRAKLYLEISEKPERFQVLCANHHNEKSYYLGQR